MCLALQTLVKGLMVQVKREKARLLMEIDEAMGRAFTILNRRYTTTTSYLLLTNGLVCYVFVASATYCVYWAWL